MTIAEHFSQSFLEARYKFLEACKRRGLAVAHHHNSKAGGVQGESLYTDVVRIGKPDARNLLVIMSGTHGVEGYCGSGIQVGLLEQGWFANLSDDLAVLMIHAINPSGFSHNRRVNEDNIDLNRNFHDFSQLVPVNEHYAVLHSAILPEEWDGPTKSHADEVLEKFATVHGQDALQSAVFGGQYSHAHGLFYGGAEPSWSRDTLERILIEHAGSARRVGMIDVHTGLGPYGVGELITIGSEAQSMRAHQWYGKQVTNPDAGSSSAKPVIGTVAHGFERILEGKETTFVAIEYGTLPLADVLDALRADNWLYLRGNVSSDLGQQIKRQVRDTFYCDADDWKQMIWERATEVIGMAVRAASEPTI